MIRNNLHSLSYARDKLSLEIGRRTWVDNGQVCFPIATFQRFEVLRDRTIPSILRQTHKNLRIVIVFDGKLDPSLDVRQILELDSRISIRELNKRTRYPQDPKERWFVAGYRPRNVGARLCRASWLFWISDDDVMLPNSVEKLVEKARSTGAESVSAGYQAGTKYPELRLPTDDLGGFGFPVTGPPAWLVRNYVGRLKWNGQSYKKAWNRPSDYDLIERMVKVGVRFDYLDEVVAIQPEVSGTGLTGWRGSIKTEAS